MSRGEKGREPPEGPSKSERKRVAHAAQDLGEALTGLRDAQLERLGLPEELLEAIRAARQITSRSGGARQRQYIGKLMRQIDLEAVQLALAADRERAVREAQQFKRVEAWRDRLLAAGEAELDELERWRPGLDRGEWRRRIAAAQAERASGSRKVAARELFRALKDLFASGP